MKSLLALVTFVLASSSVASAADAERIIVIRPARPERVVVRIERPRFRASDSRAT